MISAATSGHENRPIGTLLLAATARLAAAGVASPRVDAELLLAAALGTTRGRLALVDEAESAPFERLVARRAAREPLQHLLGSAAFRYLEVAVGPGVFIPRPETELLVDAVLPTDGVVVDLCSGSGAIALAIAEEAPGAIVYAVERSARALDWLRRNAEGSRVHVVEGDVADPSLLAGIVADVVVSNPPYVPAGSAVSREVRHDPADAVFAGQDGLAVIPHVIARAADLLKPGGRFAMEHDDTHGESVPALLRVDERWREVTDHLDLAGRPRFVTATRA